MFPEYAAEIRAYDERWDEMVAGTIEGSVSSLGRLRAAGVPLYAITNFSRAKFDHATKRFPFLLKFHGIIVSAYEGLVRPDPAIFELFLERFGLSAPDCLFIDDSATNIESARKLGMAAHHFRDAETLETVLCEHALICARLSDVGRNSLHNKGTRMKIVALTGAGVSADSGLGTFRDRNGTGIWSRFDPRKLATPEAFASDPDEVNAFYNARRRNLIPATPNPAHFALARLETALAERGGDLTLITQNIDDLHERAGSTRVIHMHGELLKARCTDCEGVNPWRKDLGLQDQCPVCGRMGGLRLTSCGSARCRFR